MHTFTLALSLSSAFPHCSVTDSLSHSVYIPNLRRCCFGEAKTFKVLVEAKEGESRAACYRLDVCWWWSYDVIITNQLQP